MTTFGKKIQGLPEHQGCSQPEFAKKTGASGAIVGLYERGQVTPSIEVARKLAHAFGGTVDSLAGAGPLPGALRDRTMLTRRQGHEGPSPDGRERILIVPNELVRDARARRANNVTG